MPSGWFSTLKRISYSADIADNVFNYLVYRIVGYGIAPVAKVGPYDGFLLFRLKLTFLGGISGADQENSLKILYLKSRNRYDVLALFPSGRDSLLYFEFIALLDIDLSLTSGRPSLWAILSTMPSDVPRMRLPPIILFYSFWLLYDMFVISERARLIEPTLFFPL